MCRLADDLTEEFVSGRFDERKSIPVGRWFLWFMAGVCALLVASLMVGCMTLTVSDSILVNSTISQDKPIKAGIATTPEAIADVMKAIGYGNPLSVDEIKELIKVLKTLRGQKESRYRSPKQLLPTRDPNRKPARLLG